MSIKALPPGAHVGRAQHIHNNCSRPSNISSCASSSRRAQRCFLDEFLPHSRSAVTIVTLDTVEYTRNKVQGRYMTDACACRAHWINDNGG